MAIRTQKTETFKYGIVDAIEARAIPRGASSRSLNWLTMGDHIELRRGFEFMGTDSQQSGSGRVTGIKKATGALSVEVLFYTYGKKAKYYDEATGEFVEIGSDLLGTAADGEDISIEEYVSISGNQVWLNSPNCAGLFKIMTANPGTAKNNYDSSKNYKGHINIDTNAMFLWRRKEDKTGIYRSYIDSQTYTTVTAEARHSGNGSTTAFSGTLSAVTGKRTCFAVTFTDGTETFTDNNDGTLTGSAGGTGTINYSSGAYSITFAVAPSVGVNNITATYQWEDSTSGGLADFTGSTAGQGTSFRQDEGGGPVQTVKSYSNIYFCMHERKTWALTLAVDDTPAETSNVPYRQNVGIPNLRAAVETGEGIYYIDKVSGQDPAVRRLTYDIGGSQQIIPVPLSEAIDLNAYEFDQAAGFAFGDFVLFACRTTNSSKNNRTLLYNRQWKSWDVLDYAVSCFDVYDGALVAGDAFTNNVMQLFSGNSDDEAIISNVWEGKLDDLEIEGLKKSKRLRLRGAIGITQKIKVSLAFDNGPFVEVGGSDSGGVHTYAIEGTGSYVDRTQRVSVGPQTLGRGELGGGSDGVEAYSYERLFKLATDKFDTAKIRFEAMDVGYASVSDHEFWDIRFKGVKVPRKYRG